MKFSFCTLCKGRRWQLEQTLPANLEAIRSLDAEIVLVDYLSRDGLAEWITCEFRKEMDAGKLAFYRLTDDLPFSIPVGKNFAHRLASGDFLVNVDADNFIGDLAEVALASPGDEVLCCDHYSQGVFGRIGARREWFERVNGYDEELLPAGYEDEDLIARLVASGLRRRHVPPSIPAIQNTLAERVSNLSRGANAVAMNEQNKARCRANLAAGRLKANPEGLTTATFLDPAERTVRLERGAYFAQARSQG
jgi:hypothetical protein